jgi:AcrR family transcriptional regulator
VVDGYSHVSMRKIAERIEYSAAAIYSYFPSKDDIFFALAEEGFERLHAMATSVPLTPDPVENLTSRLWAFYRFSREHPEHFALMFLDRTVPRIRTHYEQFRVLNAMKEEMAGPIAACVASGAFPGPVDPPAAFRVLGAALSGAATACISDRLGQGEDADRLARDVIDVMIAGFRSGAATTFVPNPHACFARGNGAGAEATPQPRYARPASSDTSAI